MTRAEPSQPLPVAARTMWWCEAAGLALAPVLLALMASAWIPPAAALLAAAVAVAAVAALPPVRWRRFRWDLHAEEVDLQHGAWRVVRTIVPITRIQHVSVERTGWTDLFGLVRLHVHTAAGKTTIPGLERPVADDVRDRILARLRTPDDL